MSGTVVNAHSVAKSMEKAGFFVIESAVSASTLCQYIENIRIASESDDDE